MKNFLLIYNPRSGDAYFKYKVDDFLASMQEIGCNVIAARTNTKSDMRTFVEFAQKNNMDGILVSGGDGTINEAVNSMLNLKLDIPLGIIPSGTSNDLATYLKLPNDLKELAKTFAAGNNKAVDIGKANNQYFLNVASAGLLASVAHTADTTLKNTFGKVAYYLKGIEELPKFKPISVEFDIDGTIIQEEIFLFVVLNSGTVGTFTKVAPLAKLDDGKLDIVYIQKCNLAELMRIFIALLTGTELKYKQVKYYQGTNIKIKAIGAELESDLDGELGPYLPLDITIESKTLKLFIP